MRIEDVRTYEISYERRNLQVVHITTDEGLDGVGEAGLTSSELAVAGAVAHFPRAAGRGATPAGSSISGRTSTAGHSSAGASSLRPR